MKTPFKERIRNISGADYETTFWNAMRGKPELLADVSKFENEDNGMNVLPLGSNKKFTEKLTERSAFRDIASVFQTYDAKYKFLAHDTEEKASWIAEDGEIPVSDATADFNSLTSSGKKLASILKLESSFIHDNGFDIEDYLTNRLSRTFARAEDEGFITGDGITAPFGIMHPEHGATTGVETDALSFDDITALFFSVDPEYRENATWMMNDETAHFLRSLKDDSGNYLWRGRTDELMGRPVRISNFMPGAESGKCPVAFGDFSYYWIVVRGPIEVRVLSELYSLEGKTGYHATEMLDGFLMRKSAIKTIRLI